MLRNSFFARAVTAAVARSRSRVCLHISGAYDVGCEPKAPIWSSRFADPDLLADPDRLVESGLTHTQMWFNAQGQQAHEAPQSLLYELPLEMRAAGAAHLVGFKADISRPDVFTPELSSVQISSTFA